MPEAGDPVFDFATRTPGLRKLGLLFGNQLYEVNFEADGRPIGGAMALQVLRMKLPLAAALEGILLILSEGPLRLLLGRNDQGQAVFRPRVHLKGLAARHSRWLGLTRSDLLDAFQADRRLAIITRPDDCHHIDECVLPLSEPPGRPAARAGGR